MKRKNDRRYAGLLAILLAVVLFLSCGTKTEAKEAFEEELYAKGICLMDGTSGRVLYGREEDTAFAMASTTKIMTCILALENGDPKMEIEASQRAAKAPKVHMGVRKGQRFLMENLLYALMLESYNDAAVMIAEGIGGSVEAFADQMNQKATKIGCRDTHFVTPNGLDASDEGGEHHTTPSDLALIMRYCVSISPKKTEFLKITQMASYSFWDSKNESYYHCTNHNAFLYMMEGALSGKTGFTTKAGYCYVGALERDGKLLIVSLLACGWPDHKNYKWSDTRILMSYGIENYEQKEIYQEELLEDKIPVCDGQYDQKTGEREAYCKLVYQDGAEISDRQTILIKKDEQIQIVKEIPDSLQAPVQEMEKVGSVSYWLNGEKIKEYPVYTDRSVKKIDFWFCLKKILLVYLGQ